MNAKRQSSDTRDLFTNPGDLAETRTLVELMIRGLVDEPAEVNLRVLEGRQSVAFEVEVAPPDIRRVIGRQGRTADAIRELLMSYGGKEGRRYLLEILEPQER